MNKKKTMADFLKEQADKLDCTKHFIYCDTPFPCGLPEALIHMKAYDYPEKERIISITQEKENLITIQLKPIKGSRKRKPLSIKLWYA